MKRICVIEEALHLFHIILNFGKEILQDLIKEMYIKSRMMSGTIQLLSHEEIIYEMIQLV